MDESTIRHTIDAYFAALKAQDAEAYVACFTDAAVLEDPVGTPIQHGLDAVRTFIAGIAARYAALALIPDRTVVNGASAAIAWTGRGTPRGGQEFAAEGIDVMDFDATGKIRSLRAFLVVLPS